jgi:hypothetical protein
MVNTAANGGVIDAPPDCRQARAAPSPLLRPQQSFAHRSVTGSIERIPTMM